jgi:hypothetical protein
MILRKLGCCAINQIAFSACLQPLSTLDLSLVVIDQFAMLAAVPKTIEYACMSN